MKFISICYYILDVSIQNDDNGGQQCSYNNVKIIFSYSLLANKRSTSISLEKTKEHEKNNLQVFHHSKQQVEVCLYTTTSK